MHTKITLAAALAAAVLAAPGAGAQDGAPVPPDGPQAYFGERITGANPQAEPRTTPATYSGEPLQLLWRPIGDRAVEPTMGFDGAGRIFYAGRGERNAAGVRGTKLFRSLDDGESWERIDVFQPAGDNPPPDLDPWVYVDVESGRVFEIALLVAGSFLAISDDAGDSWTSSHANSPGANDHQALTSGPPPPKNPLLTPLDPAFPEIVYYCVNHVTDARCAASRNGGIDFLTSGGPAFGPVCGLHGHNQVDREGRLLLPSGCSGLPQLAVSEDGGTTWSTTAVSDTLDTPVPHTEVAVDQAGNIYYVWVDTLHHLPYLATSTDHGKTWSAPLLIAPPTVHEANFPTIVAGEPGRIAVTFPGTTVDAQGGEGQADADPTRPWNQYVLVSTNALDARPLFQSNIANPTGDPIHRGACLNRCGGPLDFLDIQLSPTDGAVWAAVVDGCTGSCVTDPAAPADDNQGGAVKQIGGPKLVGPLPAAQPATPGVAPPPGRPVTPDTTAPALRRLRMSKRSFRIPKTRRGRIPKTVSRFRFDLSEAATVTLRFERLVGRRARRAGAIQSSAAAGANDIAFLGRTGTRPLRPGRYRVTLQAVDAAGNRSRAGRLRFTVRR